VLLAPAALSAAPAGLRGRLACVPIGLCRRLRSARAADLVLLALAVGGLSATPGAPDLRSAAVAAASRGGGVVLATAVALALVSVLPARVPRRAAPVGDAPVEFRPRWAGWWTEAGTVGR
jgi:hypothetical protein